MTSVAEIRVTRPMSLTGLVGLVEAMWMVVIEGIALGLMTKDRGSGQIETKVVVTTKLDAAVREVSKRIEWEGTSEQYLLAESPCLHLLDRYDRYSPDPYSPNRSRRKEESPVRGRTHGHVFSSF